jgi:hypothetical protein
MRLKQSLTVGAFIVVAVAATSVGVLAPTAQAGTMVVPLPITHYSHMLVDPAHRQLFITSGPGSSSILVTDYSGQTVATIPNEPGATGLALSSDGSTVYAALADADAVSAISTSTLTETTRYATGTGTEPTYVAYTSGRIWFGYGAPAQGGIGSIDPSTSAATVTLNAAPGNWYSAPMLTASPGGELVAGEPHQSPVQLASYDVSSGTATVLAPEQFLYSASNLNSVAITPDGKDVVIASGYPYYHQVYRVTDLTADGTYPTTNYPGAVSISGDGSVAAGTYANNEIFVFAPGTSTPLNTYNFGSDWLAVDGAALTPDRSELFAITLAGGPTGTPTLNIIPNPGGPGPTPTPAPTPTGTPTPTPTPTTLPCPTGTKANFRWHYSANGSSGSWSGTQTQTCPGTFSMGPQAMEGALKVAPGTTLTGGYDFTLPGNSSTLPLTVSNAKLVFAAKCVSGATPSASTFTVTMPAQSYTVTNSQWYPSGDQSSSLVYQGSVQVPNLCPNNGELDLSQGATFSAALS